MKVLAFGEILYDIIEEKPFLGGAPLNFAAHMARFGAESCIMSRLGTDQLGENAIRQIENLGVKTTFLQIDQVRPTGTVAVKLTNGQPAYTIFEEVAFDYIEPLEQPIAQDFDVLYLGTLAQRNKVSKKALEKLIAENVFSEIFYDVNLRQSYYSQEILLNSLNNCSILKLNDEEVVAISEMLFGEPLEMEVFAERIVDKFKIHTIIITEGAKGCLAYTKGKPTFVKGYPAKVVDTVGAGDAFSAAFLYQYLRYQDPVHAAEVANQLGAFVASSRGPIPEYTPEIRMILGIEGSGF